MLLNREIEEKKKKLRFNNRKDISGIIEPILSLDIIEMFKDANVRDR